MACSGLRTQVSRGARVHDGASWRSESYPPGANPGRGPRGRIDAARATGASGVVQSAGSAHWHEATEAGRHVDAQRSARRVQRDPSGRRPGKSRLPRRRGIRRMIDHHASGHADHAQAPWQLLAVEHWLRAHRRVMLGRSLLARWRARRARRAAALTRRRSVRLAAQSRRVGLARRYRPRGGARAVGPEPLGDRRRAVRALPAQRVRRDRRHRRGGLRPGDRGRYGRQPVQTPGRATSDRRPSPAP